MKRSRSPRTKWRVIIRSRWISPENSNRPPTAQFPSRKTRINPSESSDRGRLCKFNFVRNRSSTTSTCQIWAWLIDKENISLRTRTSVCVARAVSALARAGQPINIWQKCRTFRALLITSNDPQCTVTRRRARGSIIARSRPRERKRRSCRRCGTCGHLYGEQMPRPSNGNRAENLILGPDSNLNELNGSFLASQRAAGFLFLPFFFFFHLMTRGENGGIVRRKISRACAAPYDFHLHVKYFLAQRFVRFLSPRSRMLRQFRNNRDVYIKLHHDFVTVSRVSLPWHRHVSRRARIGMRNTIIEEQRFVLLIDLI